jgi:Putative zinc-finger/Lactonase, 7-bladed beta-propeller
MNVLTRLGIATAKPAAGRRGRMAATAAVATTVLAIAGAAAVAGPASAATAQAWPGSGARHAVFVQTDNTAGNAVVAYDRAASGTLTLAGTYPTGGLGGQLSGSVVDHLASQGSLRYDPRRALLYAVNAGSNTVSVFAVSGDRLHLRQVIGSGGSFPVSVATHGDLVYVLNATGGGSVQGYQVVSGLLFPIPGSNRPLGLNPAATPQYTNTPGQVAFSPDGSQLIVTTKDNGNDIDVFGVGFGGLLSASPVVNADYLEGTLSRADRRRFEAHLAGCPHCTEYLAQMRKTIELTGSISADDLSPQMQDEFIALYRQWRAGQGGSPP